MSNAMTRAEREAFLADLHVGIISIEREGRAPLTVPIWYAYEPGGEVRILTGRSSRKGALLARARRFSLCVQTETAPYKYVTVEGPVVALDPSVLERDERPMAHRYLGADFGEQYLAATAGQRADNVLVRMRPERWLSVDYAKEFGAG
jgi:nitroimidazol reductase NimA-like FMN-containing flavoprotein (pyridoxamine 5'-phosphate oxidase superfamily)